MRVRLLRSIFPIGACAHRSQEGRDCRSVDVYENGYCQVHGGDGENLRVYIKAYLRGQAPESELKKPMWRLIARIIKTKASPEARAAAKELYEKRTPEADSNLRGAEPAGKPVPMQAAALGRTLQVSRGRDAEQRPQDTGGQSQVRAQPAEDTRQA